MAKEIFIREPFGPAGMFRDSKYFYFPATQEMLDRVKPGNDIVLTVRGQVVTKTETGDTVVAGEIEVRAARIDLGGGPYDDMEEKEDSDPQAMEYMTLGSDV